MESAKSRKSNTSTALVIMLLVIGSALVDVSEADDDKGKCLAKCVIHCIFSDNPLMCAAECGVDCLFAAPRDISNQSAWKSHVDDFCQFGCAISTCSHLITRSNQGQSISSSCFS